VSKDIVYEVRCYQCETSFAPETRRCIHCGAPLARGPRTAIWVVVALVTAVASMLRTCIE
jgi:hypothetical protein